MKTEIAVTLITASTSILVAAVTFYLTKRAERLSELRRRKQEQYYTLLKAFAAFYDQTNDEIDARRNLASAINMIVLVAPQDLVEAVMQYYGEMLVWPPRHAERERLLKTVVLKMRRSLELPFNDDQQTFEFALVPVSTRVNNPDGSVDDRAEEFRRKGPSDS